MGQQQLLLMVLVLIVVAVAIVIGITIFQANAVEVNRDALLNNMQHVATLSQQFFQKPKMLGGGGGSFIGVNSPGILPSGLIDNDNGTMEFSVSNDQVEITGIGIENVDGNPIQYTLIVTSSGLGNPVKVN